MMATFQRAPRSDGIADTLSPVESNIDEGEYRAQYDRTRDSTSLAVVAAVADADDRDVIDLAPLAYSIDTDALDVLFEGPTTIGGGCIKAAFCYEGFEVTVFADGLIEAIPIENT